MRVRMLTNIGGFRNGESWPAKGGDVDLPDHEAVDMIANGYCEPVEEAPADDAESEQPRRGRKGRSGKGRKPADDGDAQPAADGDTPAADEPADAPADGEVTEPAQQIEW